MMGWLRSLLMIFYAPLNGLREVRDRASLPQSGVIALISHAVLFFYLTWLYLRDILHVRGLLLGVWAILQSAGVLIFIALVFVPLSLFIANLFERRASFRLLMQQEYSALTSTLFFAMAASSIVAIILVVAGRASGVLPTLATRMFELQTTQPGPLRPEMVPGFDARLFTPNGMAIALAYMVLFTTFGIWGTMAIRVALRLSWVRSLVIVLISGALLFPASFVLMPIFTTVLASPFLLFLLFLLLRGYVAEFGRSHRARVAFKQNLEAATLNPADASTHYNLGLIHQQRGEIDAARERFERTIQIDENEVDAHYQLGRIARQQGRLPDAIGNFEQVVSREPGHAQYEIWRDIGATYLEAGQFDDARNALEQFLEHRPSDPEGLYLMGRAHAGLGHRREAASLMQACIDAVKTAPAYKYRASKRWLNEAQQFIKSSQ
jgi:tetratricopeptide (TPR) repeat protein